MSDTHSPGQHPECASCAFNNVDMPNAVDSHTEMLLSTNYPPESAALSAIVSSLGSAQALSAKLDDWILVTQASLKRMQNAKMTVESSILRHRGVLHPIRSIPDDILLTIFDWCTVMATYRRDAMSMCTDDAPWSLSRVSRRWRALVLSSPRLWSTVNIRPLVFEADAEHMERLSSWLALYLRRSANRDLSIRVSGFVRDPEHRVPLYDDTLLERCFEELLSTTKRWRTAEFTDLPPALLMVFSGFSFDRLTDLNVTFTEGDNPIIDPIRWLTPNLAHLTLYEREVGVMEVSWEGLKSYVCDTTSFQHLPQCVALEKLDLPPIAPDSIESANFSAPFTLPALHTLNMWHSEEYYSIPQLSDLLILPSLNTLRLTFDTFRPSNYPSFHGAIPHIKNLSLIVLYNCSGEVTPLLAFLAECISVEAMCINFSIANDEVLAALEFSDRDPQSAVLLPHLTMLGIDPQLMERSPDCVMDVVISRSRGGSQSVRTLKQLTVMQSLQFQGPWQESWRNKTGRTPELEEKWTLVKRSVRVSQVNGNVFPFDSVV